MNIRAQLQLANASISAYNLGLVLMVQLGWRLWRHVDAEHFPAYHRAWWFGRGGIQPVLWPGVALQGIGSLAQVRWRPAGVPRWMPVAVLALLAANGVLTAGWWGRQQARLEQVRQPGGDLTEDYLRLMRTHWGRVAIIGLAAAVQYLMATRSIAEISAGRRPS